MARAGSRPLGLNCHHRSCVGPVVIINIYLYLHVWKAQGVPCRILEMHGSYAEPLCIAFASQLTLRHCVGDHGMLQQPRACKISWQLALS